MPPDPSAARTRSETPAADVSRCGVPATAAGHSHLPRRQSRSLAHALPHVPQLVSSVWRSTQPVVAHAVSPDVGHTQRPLLHEEPAGQALSHAPQCRSFVTTSVQAAVLSQKRSLLAAQRQVLPLQVVPAAHALSQAPQCASSVRVSTHVPAAAQ